LLDQWQLGVGLRCPENKDLSSYSTVTLTGEESNWN